MLALEVRMVTVWMAAGDTIRHRLREAWDDDGGEITATTALIVILVIAAIGAGTVIATKIANNARHVPEP